MTDPKGDNDGRQVDAHGFPRSRDREKVMPEYDRGKGSTTADAESRIERSIQCNREHNVGLDIALSGIMRTTYPTNGAGGKWRYGSDCQLRCGESSNVLLYGNSSGPRFARRKQCIGMKSVI